MAGESPDSLSDNDNDNDIGGAELSWAELVAALFEHTPGPVPGTAITGREVCRRANKNRVGRLKEPMLSTLQRGKAREPGFGIITAVADGFGVDIAFFTRESTTSTVISRWPIGCGQPTPPGHACISLPPTSTDYPSRTAPASWSSSPSSPPKMR